ncbi:hypothetical protein [Streptosporangium sp. NPDC006007]|uniref:hypothetical protein n=1 Tax=Streptosporangium sp. NPDC006007 TaxID=3154575 RepID=UPI0033B36C0F
MLNTRGLTAMRAERWNDLHARTGGAGGLLPGREQAHLAGTPLGWVTQLHVGAADTAVAVGHLNKYYWLLLVTAVCFSRQIILTVTPASAAR